MRTKLTIFPKCNLNSAMGKLKTKVMQNQREMKAYLDTKRKAKTLGLKEGDFVRVRKGKSKFSNPMQIVRRKGDT